MSTMTATVLRCQDLTLRRGDHFRLGPMSFELSPGVTCLVGPNGAGKSTLFRLLTGLESPDGGLIDFDDGAAAVGYLPQEPGFPSQATCEQFLDYVAWLQKVPAGDRSTAAARVLAAVNLSDKSGAKIRSLSGGMVRRLGIAQALIHQPGVVLLDEPTVGLDPAQRAGLRETIGQLGVDATVLVSTHLVEDVRGLADRVLVLREGGIVFDGSVGALEGLADPTAIGDTRLEKAITTVMGPSR